MMKILIASSFDNAWNSVRPEAEMFIQMAGLGHELTVFTEGHTPYAHRFRSASQE